MRRYFTFAGVLFIMLALLFTAGIQTIPARAEGNSVEAAEASDHEEITQGEKVNLADHLVAGKTVIFDFFSPYCPPCVRIKPYLIKLNSKRDDLVVKFVNINRKGVKGIDWRAPVVGQYNVSSVPHFKIYDGTGKLVAEGESAYEKVMEYIQEMEKSESK